MEIIEEELEMYNSKMRLLNWVVEEMRFHMDLETKDLVNVKGRELPLNI